MDPSDATLWSLRSAALSNCTAQLVEFLLAAQNQWVPQFGAESEEVRAFELKVDKLVAEEGAEVCTLAHEAAERYRV